MMGTSEAQRARLQLVAAEFVERLGARMREQRETLGLSMAEVARRMPGKVSENQVYRWELGKHQPKPDTLEALAKVLGTTVATLMAPTPDKTVTPDLSKNGPETQFDRIEAKLDWLLILAGVEPQEAIGAVLQHAEAAAAGQHPPQSSVAKGRARKAPPAAA